MRLSLHDRNRVGELRFIIPLHDINEKPTMAGLYSRVYRVQYYPFAKDRRNLHAYSGLQSASTAQSRDAVSTRSRRGTPASDGRPPRGPRHHAVHTVERNTAMDSTRIVNSPDGGTDIWRATDLEFLDFWERKTRLGDLFRRWQRARGPDGTVPHTPGFDLSDLRSGCKDRDWPPHCLPKFFRADVDPGAPADFRITAPGAGFEEAPLCTLFRPILRDALFADLLLCHGLREALYQQIYQKISGDEQCYVRLLLPTVDEMGNVHRIYGISRPLYAEQELVHWSTT